MRKYIEALMTAYPVLRRMACWLASEWTKLKRELLPEEDQEPQEEEED